MAFPLPAWSRRPSSANNSSRKRSGFSPLSQSAQSRVELDCELTRTKSLRDAVSNMPQVLNSSLICTRATYMNSYWLNLLFLAKWKPFPTRHLTPLCPITLVSSTICCWASSSNLNTRCKNRRNMCEMESSREAKFKSLNSVLFSVMQRAALFPFASHILTCQRRKNENIGEQQRALHGTEQKQQKPCRLVNWSLTEPLWNVWTGRKSKQQDLRTCESGWVKTGTTVPNMLITKELQTSKQKKKTTMKQGCLTFLFSSLVLLF